MKEIKVSKEVLRDPVKFAEKFFNWKAHDAQKQILRSEAQFLTVAAGRRFGKSEAMAVLSLYNAIKKPEHIQFIIAPTYDQSLVIFETILKFLGKSPFNTLIKKTRYSPYPQLFFKHGSEIHARSSDKYNNLRGRKAHMVILDEAAFVKDAAVYEVIEPMLADYNGRMIKISTPWGRNHFYESYMKGIEGVRGYESFRFPSWANPYISHEFLEMKKLEYGENSIRWKTEFEAEFIDDSSLVFPWKLIELAIEDYKIPISPEEGHVYSMGVDIAKYHDYTVIIVVDITEKPHRLVHFERFNNRPWNYIVDRIVQVQKKYKARGFVDTTGVGDPVFEHATSRGATLSPFVFTNSSKQMLIDNLRAKLENGEIVFPNIRELLDELRFFEYSLTPTGRMKMEARYGFHDDCVMALALALNVKASRVITGHVRLKQVF